LAPPNLSPVHYNYRLIFFSTINVFKLTCLNFPRFLIMSRKGKEERKKKDLFGQIENLQLF
jgi:hypothetical protein